MAVFRNKLQPAFSLSDVPYDLVRVTARQLADGAPCDEATWPPGSPPGKLPGLLIRTGGRQVFAFDRVFLRGERAVVRFVDNIYLNPEDEESTRWHLRNMVIGAYSEAVGVLAQLACRCVVFICGRQLAVAVFSGPEPIDPANILA